MCGRFTQVVKVGELAALYGPAVSMPDAAWAERWNGAPTQAFLVCRLDAAGRRVLSLLRWGLVPPWARDRAIGNRLINARSETVAGKPAFRAAFRRRRCLVPAIGWFEWRRTPAGKEPTWIRLAGGRPFSFAGLWEAWGEGGSRMESFTILTCPAGEALASVHARQPAVVAPEEYGAWLDAETTAERVQAPHRGRSRSGGWARWRTVRGTTCRRSCGRWTGKVRTCRQGAKKEGIAKSPHPRRHRWGWGVRVR